MNKPNSKPWHRLWIVIPAFVIFPLGLFLLWSSPRSLRSKLTATAMFVVIVGGVAAGVVSTGLYDRVVGSRALVGEYDTTMDSRGNYRTSAILPFEREVHAAVVHKMRTYGSSYSPDAEDMSLYMIVPELRAFEAVAEEKGLPAQDVESIYLKVSHQI